MKKKLLLSIILFCIIFTSCEKNKTFADKPIKLNTKYVAIEDLSKLITAKHLNNDVYYFKIANDSIPYIIGVDSLYQIKIDENSSILYYNSSLFSNGAFIIYKNIIKENEKFVKFNVNTIMKASAFHINNYILFKVETSVNQLVFKSDYFIFSLLTNNISNMCILTKGSYWKPDSRGIFTEYMDMHLQDNVVNGKIYIEGVIKGKIIKDSIIIDNNQFCIPNLLRDMKWDEIKIINPF